MVYHALNAAQIDSTTAWFICNRRLCAPHGPDDTDDEGDDNDASADDDDHESTRLRIVTVMKVMKAHNS